MRDVARRGLAVGFFDGVHLGHRAILARASVALTFTNHPLSLLAPERAPRLLSSVEDRIAAIRGCGVERVVALDFTRELAGMSPEGFADRYVAGLADGGMVYCGDDWRFGRGGAGDAGLLGAMGFSVEVVPSASYRGARISSTRIRAAIESGDVEGANDMLGCEWSARGEVFRGKGLGAGIGFPTVNVRLGGFGVRLARGVYEVCAGGSSALANYGVAPTLRGRSWDAPVLEMHFTGAVPRFAPGDEARVFFRRFVRPEIEFRSVEALKDRIMRDLASVERRRAGNMV